MQRTRKQQRHPALPCFSGRSTNGLNVLPLSRLAAGGMLTLLSALPLSATAQNRPSGRNTPPQPGIRANVQRPAFETPPVGRTGLALNISAESAPYHLDWNGTSGTLTRRALGAQPEVRLPLTYIHSEPGPKGYSKYLAWFLARDKDHFSIVWAYLNDGGREFFCWVYQYPSNQLTSLRFTGDYRFAPLPEPVAPTQFTELSNQVIPSYTGPDFKYRDWTRRSGLLDTLQLQPAGVTSFAAPLEQPGIGNRGQGAGNSQSPIPNPQSAIGNRQSPIANSSKSVSGLRVYPLHEIQVAKGNGWRDGGWRELHALAYDSASDPYYLILYSNATKGYVVDLKRAQTYVADFGATVVFSNDNTVFGSKEETVVGPPDARIRRYARVELPLVTTQKYANPYSNVDVYMDFRGPDGKTVTVPGYWDGGQTWRVRFTPTLAGRYSWRSYSTDTELGDQVGSFTCVADDTNSRGFVTVNAQRFYPHSFASANGLPFFPVFLRDPVHYFPAPDTSPAPAAAPKVPAKAPASAAGEVSLTIPLQDNGGLPSQNNRALPGQSNPLAPMQDKSTGTGSPLDTPLDDPTLLDLNSQNTPRTFTAFTRRVDDAAAVGFNRFWGGWLLDPTLFSQHKQANEGGAPFVNYDLDTINPEYFQWMDRRIAYCNERGIVPDIGITDIGAPLLQEASPIQISRLWKYALARYSAFNVNWNLFGKAPNNPYPPDVNSWVEPLATLTDHYDPIGHPLTLVVPNSAPQANVVRPAGAPTGPPTIIRPDNPVIIRPDVPGNGGPGSNPTVITPQTPVPNTPQAGTPGNAGTSRSAGTPGTPGTPNAPQIPGSNNRRNGNRGNNGANNSGNNGGQNPGRSATGANRRGANANGRATGAGTQVPNAPGTTSGGQPVPGSPANGFPQNQGTPNGFPSNGAPANGFPANGFPANGFPANGFPANGFPSGGQFPNRSAGANMGAAQGMGGDPRMQGRGSRQRGGRGRNGFGGFGGANGSGGALGATEVTGNTTSNDYITNVDPDVAAALRSDRAAQHGPAQPTSIPLVRYAHADWLDVITLAGGDLSTLKYDYNLNKPLVVQDITGVDATDATRHRLWQTVMQGGFWQGAATANTGVADPLNSALARWQLACARLFKQTQYTRLIPHQDMIGGPEESPFERRRRKRAQAESAFENAQPGSGASTTDPGNATGRGTNAPSAPGNPNFPGRASDTGGQNAPGTPNGSGQPLPGLNGGGDEFGNDFPGGFPSPNMPAVPAKATPGAIYVLADPGWEYVVYFESGGAITLDLLESIGTIRQSWFNPRTGEYASQETMKGGIYKTFTAPDSNDWVLLLSRRPEAQPQRNTGTVRTASDIR